MFGYKPVPTDEPGNEDHSPSRPTFLDRINATDLFSKTSQKKLIRLILAVLVSTGLTVWIITFNYQTGHFQPYQRETIPIDYPESDLGVLAWTTDASSIIRSMLENKTFSNNSCTIPATKVAFAKTHKTASSTVQNIIFRYALDHEWNVAMYEHGSHLGPPNNQYKLDKPFQSSWLKNVLWKDMIAEQGYNAFAYHTMWNKPEVSKLLGNDTVYFTILRSPVDAFESLYNYVHFDKDFKMDLEEFAQEYIARNLPVRRLQGYLGRNQQFWDLGRFSTTLRTVEDVKKKIKEIEREFDLVMITEDMESSLVLLSQQLCWPLNSFTSLKVNSRPKSSVEHLSQETRKLLKDWLWADEMLYSYFKQVLDKKKEQYGLKEMEAKVNDLKKMNKEVKNVCIEKKTDNRKELSPGFRPWGDVLGFKVNTNVTWCKFYGLTEIAFIDLLRERQIDKFRDWKAQKKSLTSTDLAPVSIQQPSTHQHLGQEGTKQVPVHYHTVHDPAHRQTVVHNHTVDSQEIEV